MEIIALKSRKAFLTYLLGGFFSTFILVLWQMNLKKVDIETIVVLGLLYVMAIIFDLSSLIMVFLPKTLIVGTENELILKRRFINIKLNYDSIISVTPQHAYSRLGRYGSRNIEHSFGSLVIKTRKRRYYVIGVADIDTVQSTIMSLKQNR